MPAPATQSRAELYLRGDTYGTFDAQQDVLNSVRALEADDVLDEGRGGRRGGRGSGP